MIGRLKRIIKRLTPRFLKGWYHKVLAIAACVFYGFPSKKLIVIGVTGTNGKTTTCNLIASILGAAGVKFGMTTTIQFQVADKKWKNESKMTSLGFFTLQRLLRQMVRAGCKYAIIETSSHALDQHRVWGVFYDAVALTNITPEHLDYHRTMEEYQEVKSRLFAKLYKSFRKKDIPKTMVLNYDDASFVAFSRFQADQKFAYAVTEAEGELISPPEDKWQWVVAKNLNLEPEKTSFKLSSFQGEVLIQLSLPGKFNVYNSLAATGVCLGLGFEQSVIASGLQALTLVPGRMERIDEGQDFTVIIDYAVTPDSLEKLYESVSRMNPKKIIAVFGSAGERDRVKRPVMGEIVARFADLAIVTNEDPFWEDPWQVINEVAEGLARSGKIEGKDWFKIFDRREAIRFALVSARKGDIVLITGKGAETTMAVQDKRIPWDDREVTREILREIRSSRS